MIVSSTGVSTQPVAGTGAEWDWTVAAAPGYVVDGHTADEFLVWATRQLGLRLRYADDAAHFHSRTVIMHGSDQPVSVAQGLDVVDSTTGLDLDESEDGALRVSLRSRNP
jgi:hypothetical protein